MLRTAVARKERPHVIEESRQVVQKDDLKIRLISNNDEENSTKMCTVNIALSDMPSNVMQINYSSF